MQRPCATDVLTLLSGQQRKQPVGDLALSQQVHQHLLGIPTSSCAAAAGFILHLQGLAKIQFVNFGTLVALAASLTLSLFHHQILSSLLSSFNLLPSHSLPISRPERAGLCYPHYQWVQQGLGWGAMALPSPARVTFTTELFKLVPFFVAVIFSGSPNSLSWCHLKHAPLFVCVCKRLAKSLPSHHQHLEGLHRYHLGW